MLHDACKNGNENAAKYLVDVGANVNIKNNAGKMPLHIACKNGNETIVRYLIAHGADAKGFPLTEAMNLNDEIIKLLIDRGADVNSKDHLDNTPLCKAYKNNNKAIVKYLLERNADANVKLHGETLLSKAYKRGDLLTAMYLIKHGADFKISDEFAFPLVEYFVSPAFCVYTCWLVWSTEFKKLEISPAINEEIWEKSLHITSVPGRFIIAHPMLSAISTVGAAYVFYPMLKDLYTSTVSLLGKKKRTVLRQLKSNRKLKNFSLWLQSDYKFRGVLRGF